MRVCCCCRKHPILLQGPTSSGKTSLVGYLAAQTGHKLVRINNHERTDLQVGAYAHMCVFVCLHVIVCMCAQHVFIAKHLPLSRALMPPVPLTA